MAHSSSRVITFPCQTLVHKVSTWNAASPTCLQESCSQVTSRQASLIVAQPSPFPCWLVIHQATNTIMVFHGITTFYPPLGISTSHHPATGATIALPAKKCSQETPFGPSTT